MNVTFEETDLGEDIQIIALLDDEREITSFISKECIQEGNDIGLDLLEEMKQALRIEFEIEGE